MGGKGERASKHQLKKNQKVLEGSGKKGMCSKGDQVSDAGKIKESDERDKAQKKKGESEC